MNFHFHIPNYTSKSNGIVLLWEAAYNFSLVRNVTVTSFGYGEDPEEIPHKYKKLIIESFINDCDSTVVVYPECVHSNVLGAKNVAWYLMARPFILNGLPVAYEKTDFVFAYSKAISMHLPQYNISNPDLLDLKAYDNVSKIPGKLVIYYGKCRVAANFKCIKKHINNASEIQVITRTFPTSKSDLYKNIAEAELLISIDPLTNILYEATLLGTNVLVADDVFDESYKNYNFNLVGFHYHSDFSAIDHETLKHEARKIFAENCERSSERTMDIIAQIEIHFDHIESNPIRIESLKHLDRVFYRDIWKSSPIFNGNNANSLLMFHLLRKNLFAYYLLKYTKRFVTRVFLSIKNYRRSIRILLEKFLDPADMSYFMYYYQRRKNTVDAVKTHTMDFETGNENRIKKQLLLRTPFYFNSILKMIWTR